jgi:hypothetical protein
MIRTLFQVGGKYGLMASFLSILAFLVLQLTDQEPLLNLHLLILDGLVFALALGVALKDFRDYYHGGVLTFGQGMTLSFAATVVFALLFGLFMILFIHVFSPDFFEMYQSLLLEQIQNLPAEELDADFRREQMALAQGLKRSDLLIDVISKKLLTGLLLGPVMVVFFRRMPQNEGR